MSQTEPGPRRATAQDLGEVVSILVSAFYEDPTWSWAFPDPSRRREQQRRLWTLLVESAQRYPWVWLTTGGTATSVWIPPGGTELPEGGEVALQELVVDLLGEDAPRVMHLFDQFDQAHPQDVPHFYLTLLGTLTEHRGRGHGLGLLADNLRHVDEAHQPAYLEASNPANVALYARYGFEVRDSFTLPAGGPEVVTMWRDPR